MLKNYLHLEGFIVKKFICMLLSLIVALSTCVVSVCAQSERKSKFEAMKWAKSQVDQSVDFDNQNGAQCVDLIMAYYDFLGEKRGIGNAVDYVRNKIPDGWKRIKDAKPRMGDVLIYEGEPDIYYGHLGIYESKNSSYHQANGVVYNTNKPYYMITSSRGAPYWGVIRPVFADDEKDESTSDVTVTKPNNSFNTGFAETESTTQTDQTTQSVSSSVVSQVHLSRPSIKSAKIKGKSIRVSWKKINNADGYQVKYSTNKKFKSKFTKTKIVKNKNSYKIKKIKSNKNYYVKIRTYKKTGNKTIYSKWSKRIKVVS